MSFYDAVLYCSELVKLRFLLWVSGWIVSCWIRNLRRIWTGQEITYLEFGLALGCVNYFAKLHLNFKVWTTWICFVTSMENEKWVWSKFLSLKKTLGVCIILSKCIWTMKLWQLMGFMNLFCCGCLNKQHSLKLILVLVLYAHRLIMQICHSSKFSFWLGVGQLWGLKNVVP